MSRSGARAALRIGWRSIRRSRGRSALVAVMVLLPVAAMAAGITAVATVTPTPEASARHRMGAADYEVQQSSPGGTTEGLRALLPEGAIVEPWSYDDPTLVLPGREVRVGGRSLDVDGLARGMLTITAGRQPERAGEVAVSAGVAELAGVAIGDRLEIRESGPATVVGLVEDPFDIHGRLILLPGEFAEALGSGAHPSGGSVSWLVGMPPGADDALLAQREVACDGENVCLYWVTSRAEASRPSNEAMTPILVLGGLVLAESILIASAAFAVGIRRRQRELGLLAAAGADRRQLAGAVLSEGVLLGAVGAAAGVVLGVGAVAAAGPWLDELTNRRNPPLTIELIPLVMAAALGLLACLIAAASPAWSAARLPVLVALSGRRPALRPARRILVVGIALVTLGALVTSTGAAMRLSDPSGSLAMFLLSGGAIVGVFGFGACSPWLVERLEPLGRRLPAAARLALRDTARARSRSSPIVTAILAALAATVALAAFFASTDAEAAANWRPWARPDNISIGGPGAGRGGPEVARQLGAIAAAPIPLLATRDGIEAYVALQNPDAPAGERDLGYRLTIGDAELMRALGVETGTDALAGGHVVLLVDEPVPVTRLTVRVLDAFTEEELASDTLPVTVIATGLEMGSLADAVLAPETAERLGLVSGETWTYVIRLDHAVSDADVARAGLVVATEPDTFATAALGPARSGDLFRLLLALGSLLFALSVTAIGVALGESESRSDQRTLLAVGADPGMRRRIAAARAGVVALLAGVLAVPAGLLPAWGLLGSRDAPLVVPIPEVLAAVVVLPLAGVLGALVLSRGIPAWSSMREVAS